MLHPQEWGSCSVVGIAVLTTGILTQSLATFQKKRQMQGAKWPCQSQSIRFSRLLACAINRQPAPSVHHIRSISFRSFCDLHLCFVSHSFALTQTPFEQCCFLLFDLFLTFGNSLLCLESDWFFLKWQNRSRCCRQPRWCCLARHA